MVLFPNGKINLGLNITRKRADGYHDLETIFYPIGWQDALECIPASDKETESGILFSASGIPIEGKIEHNLCVKAYQLLKKDYPTMGAVSLHLHKEIPMGAGLGGGSADGAFTLKLLDQLFQLNLSQAQLTQYALILGSDCPFFIINQPCLATGRGEKMQPISLDLSAYCFQIVQPPVHVSTLAAFAGIFPKQNNYPLSEIIQQDPASWKEVMVNDFETSVGKKYPVIQELKQSFYSAGAIYAAMSGSGSAVYGLFEKNKKPRLNYPSSFRVFTSN